MNTRKQIIFPKLQEILNTMGEQFKLARKRRSLTLMQVAERASIHRETLRKIEKGDASVALGSYFKVLRVMNLEKDFLKLAADDEFGKKLQDLNLLNKQN
jgi:transcriptional regulator with XRE-family HTH domain